MWIENDGTRIRLLSAELGTQRTTELAVVASGTTLSHPVISNELIVWAEQMWPDRTDPTYPRSSTVFSKIRAYNRGTGTTKVIAEPTWINLQYAVSGQRVVYTDPRLVLVDVAAGTTKVLDEGSTTAPAFSNDVVVWSSTAPTSDDYDVYGFDLARNRRARVVSAPGNQINPVIIGKVLVWQDEADSRGRGRVDRKPLAQAFENAATSQAQPQPEASTGATPDGSIGIMNHTGSFTKPTYKGMHLAIGGYGNGWGGWYFSTGQPCNGITCIVDGLGAPNGSFFGSYLVMETELGYNTGRTGAWGSTVAGAMKGQQAAGARVIVRTYPTYQPNPSGTVNPADVVNRVISLAQTYDWVKNVQLDNEPNLEWNPSCTNCRWNTSSTTYTWVNRDDPQFYYAMNEFYSDAWWDINYWKNNWSDPTVRARLAAMEIWTPPMSDFYKPMSNGQSMYVALQSMIDLFDRFAYHTYPAPNFDADGAGGVKNNSWPQFSSWLKTSINNATVRSMILEFGWNPGQMERTDCNMAQHKTWPSTGACAASDGLTHTFDNDIKRFLANQRYGAEVVAVWMLRGWRNNNIDHTDAIDQNGNTRPWFHNYQWSSP